MTSEKIVHNCKKHGALTIDQVYINKKLRKKDGRFYANCKACVCLAQKKYGTAGRSLLSDAYIKKLLTSRGDIQTKDIPDELVELKRLSVELQYKKKEQEKSDLEKWLREQFINDNSKL